MVGRLSGEVQQDRGLRGVLERLCLRNVLHGHHQFRLSEQCVQARRTGLAVHRPESGFPRHSHKIFTGLIHVLHKLSTIYPVPVRFGIGYPRWNAPHEPSGGAACHRPVPNQWGRLLAMDCGGDYQPIPPEGLPLPHQAEGRHAGQGTAFGHPVQDPVHRQALLYTGEEDGGAGPADSGRIPEKRYCLPLRLLHQPAVPHPHPEPARAFCRQLQDLLLAAAGGWQGRRPILHQLGHHRRGRGRTGCGYRKDEHPVGGENKNLAQRRVFFGRNWRQPDSNRRPIDCEPIALPTELCPQ